MFWNFGIFRFFVVWQPILVNDSGFLEKVYSIPRTGFNIYRLDLPYFEPWYTLICNYLQASFHLLNLVTLRSLSSSSLISLRVWRMSGDILLVYNLHHLSLTVFLLQSGNMGSGRHRWALVTIWFLCWLLPITHLPRMAVLSRPTIYEGQDTIWSSWQLQFIHSHTQGNIIQPWKRWKLWQWLQCGSILKTLC